MPLTQELGVPGQLDVDTRSLQLPDAHVEQLRGANRDRRFTDDEAGLGKRGNQRFQRTVNLAQVSPSIRTFGRPDANEVHVSVGCQGHVGAEPESAGAYV